MAIKNTINSVVMVFNNMEFVPLLDIAETIAAFTPIPSLARVIKVLRFFIKVQPAVKKTSSAMSVGDAILPVKAKNVD